MAESGMITLSASGAVYTRLGLSLTALEHKFDAIESYKAESMQSVLWLRLWTEW